MKVIISEEIDILTGVRLKHSIQSEPLNMYCNCQSILSFVLAFNSQNIVTSAQQVLQGEAIVIIICIRSKEFAIIFNPKS
jgi:hypothetical protein